MKKLFVTALFLMLFGSAFAQSSYFGINFGAITASSGGAILNFGAHGGARNLLSPGVGVRAGLDFGGVVRLAADVTYDIPVAGSPVGVYVGVGPDFLTAAFGAHGTLGFEYPLPASQLAMFGEVQPVYSFTGGTFSFYLKMGANFRL